MFEDTHKLRDRGRADVERPRGSGKAAAFGRTVEILNRAKLVYGETPGRLSSHIN
jgi:hypothetical protein